MCEKTRSTLDDVETPSFLPSIRHLNQASSKMRHENKIDKSVWGDEKAPNVKDQLEISLKLLQLDSQFPIMQINGQRKLGPPPDWIGPPPGPGCEIFVGSIPRTCYEPVILPIFSSVGNIYELRLMMDFSGMNRGYCFVMYTKPEEAARAVKELDQYEIYPGKRIGVVASINNCRLYISPLPSNIDSEIVIKQIYSMTDDVDRIAIYRNLKGAAIYIIVFYKNHRGAAMGKRRLVPESLALFYTNNVNIEWADPNITPSNVIEESGTCDEDGNVKITKTFIPPAGNKTFLPGRYWKNADKRFGKSVNQRMPLKSLNSTISHNHDTNSLSNSSKNLENFPNDCSNSESNYSVNCLKSCSFMDVMKNDTKENLPQLCDVNGNLRNIFDQSIPDKRSEENSTDLEQWRTIAPPTGNCLKNRNSSANLEWNGLQRNTQENFNHKKIDGTLQTYNFFGHPMNESYGIFNNYTVNGDHREKNIAALNNFQLGNTQPRINQENINFGENANWNCIENVAPKFSEILNISNDNVLSTNCMVCKQKKICQNNISEQQLVNNNIEQSCPSISKLWLVNGFDNHALYSNYFRNFPYANNVHQDNVSTVQQFNEFPGQISNNYQMQNFQRPALQTFSHQKSLQIIRPTNGSNPMIFNQQNFGIPFNYLPGQFYTYYDRNIEEMLNGDCNRPENIQSINYGYNQQEIAYQGNNRNHETKVNPFLDSTPAMKYLPSVLPKNPLIMSSQNNGFIENNHVFTKDLSSSEKARFLRPILKGTTANMRTYY